MSSPLGEVVNVSASGLGVYCKRRPVVEVGHDLRLAVAFDGRIEPVLGHVKRLDPVGPRGVELGLELKDVPATLQAWIDARTAGAADSTSVARVYVAA